MANGSRRCSPPSGGCFLDVRNAQSGCNGPRTHVVTRGANAHSGCYGTQTLVETTHHTGESNPSMAALGNTGGTCINSKPRQITNQPREQITNQPRVAAVPVNHGGVHMSKRGGLHLIKDQVRATPARPPPGPQQTMLGPQQMNEHKSGQVESVTT